MASRLTRLCVGTAALVLALSAPAVAQMVTGTYLGNATPGRAFTGLGFRPDVVIIKGYDFDPGLTLTSTVMRTSTMSGDNTKPLVLDNALTPNLIQSLDFDGFTIGSGRQVNQAGITFFWVAFQANADLTVGTYTGDGTASQPIAGVGFSPEFVIVMSSGARRAIQACSAAPAGRSFEFDQAAKYLNQITALGAAGFTVSHAGAQPYVNQLGVVYHYVAWNESPGKVKVGSYNGNLVDNRSIAGVGFQPEYLIVKSIYNDNAGGTAPPAHQRYYPMAVDNDTDFSRGVATNHIQAFETDGFQIGNALTVNRTFADCNLDGPGCAYFYVAFNQICPLCPPLAVSETATTLTVTASNSFEMTFDTSTAGGAIAKFYDLAEDPGRATDLAGSLETSNGPRGLHSFGMRVGAANYNSANNVAGAGLDLLEATPTRVRVRPQSFYQAGVAGAILAGVKGVSDYSIYGSGRVALHHDRQTTAIVNYSNEYSELVVHYRAPVSPPLDSWAVYRELGAGTPNPGPGTGTDLFVMAKNEVAGARTDFLQVLYRGWTAANGYPNNATLTDFTVNGGTERINTYWFDGNAFALPAGSRHSWDSVTYFKPTNFTTDLDPAVTSRRNDYRTPSAVTVGPGAQWQDAAENTSTGGDFFNEAEAVYVFDLNPATGLSFSMTGSGANPRYSPFFKVRQWRSFVEAPVVTFDPDGLGAAPAAPLAKNSSYRAAVKPFARAHFTQDVLWHSTLQDAASVNATPDVGSAGVSNAVGYVAARYGQGANVTANNQYVSIPLTDGAGALTGDFDGAKGALEFWYKPTWNHNDAVQHDLGGVYIDASAHFLIQKLATNVLRFRIALAGTFYDCTVAPADYSWRADDWVHLRIEWDDSPVSGPEQRIVINQAVPTQTCPGDWASAGVPPPSMAFRLGDIADGAGTFGAGTYDEVYSYGRRSGHTHAEAPTTPKRLAHGGLTSDATEYLAADSAPKNFQLAFAPVDANKRGEFAYFGADSKFRGLNVSLATAGTWAVAGDLSWEYWDGSAWTNLEAFGFIDETLHFTKAAGTIYWSSDPTGWSPYSVNGGPDLYYVRARLPPGGSYAVAPTERVIKTDILLFQYCPDVTTANATFAFAAPPTTEVKLSSFTATAGDASVVLDWRTASELDNLGFHLYRGLSGNGPWTRLTASLIPGLGSSAVGQAYSFRDAGLQNGTRYYYRLEDVDASSKTTSHGPVSAVPVAGAASGAPGAEPPASSGKKKGAASPSCPDWVVSAYGSSVGSDGATASLSCTRHGDPESVGLEVLSRDARSAVLELRTGGFYALHTLSGAGEASGGVRVFVPGFDVPQDAQGAALPARRALVDAVVGRRVRLGGVRALDQVGFRGLVPSALGEAEMQVSWDGTVRAGRRAVRATGRGVRELAPGRSAQGDLVKLLPSVFQGEAKSAVVEITPLRYDARRQQLVLAKRVRVRLLFTGRETGERGEGRFGRREKPQPPVSGEVLARLYTTSRGLYAVGFEQLFPGRRQGYAASELRLERQWEAVGIHLEPSSASFGPGSVLYFHADRTASSTDYSSEVAFELRHARGGVVMPLASVTPSGAAVASAPLGEVAFETNRFYQPGLLEAADPWLWEALPSGAARTQSLSLAGVDQSSTAAELEVFLQGASESGGPIDHHLSVSLNGVPVGEAQFAGKTPYRMSLGVPASLLREGTNELQLTNVGDTGVSSFVFLDRFTLVHPQLSFLAGGRFEGTWPESGTASLAGVAGPVALVDVTQTARWLAGYESAGGTLRFRAEAGHRYLAVSQDGLLAPRVAGSEPSTLRASTNRADYILIAPRAFLGAAEPLVQRRSEQGLQARAVAFEEIAAEFGHGQPSAEAIQAFLAYAFQSWTRPSPRYVLLLGDASYDPRNFMGSSPASPLPALWTKTSYLWTVSDPLLAAVNGEDALPDLAIGRLPAASVEQAQALVQKLLAWEDSGQGLAGQAALVADNPDIAGDFEADVRDIAQSYLAGRSPQLLLMNELGPEMRPRILDALNSGLSYLSYVGHGGAAVWASENVWNSWDAASLQAQSLQPLLITMNCLNGYFVAPAFESLSESLLKAEGRGAIAAFSPSGLSLDGPAHQYHRALMAELTNDRHERLGDALTAAQQAYAGTGLMPELLSIYQLLGDPATRIR